MNVGYGWGNNRYNNGWGNPYCYNNGWGNPYGFNNYGYNRWNNNNWAYNQGYNQGYNNGAWASNGNDMEAEDITTDKEEVEVQDLQYHLHMVIEEDPLQELVQDKFLQTQEYTLVHNLRELL